MFVMIFCMDSTAGARLCSIPGLLTLKPSGTVLTGELQAKKVEGEGGVLFLLVVMWLLQVPDVALQKAGRFGVHGICFVPSALAVPGAGEV